MFGLKGKFPVKSFFKWKIKLNLIQSHTYNTLNPLFPLHWELKYYKGLLTIDNLQVNIFKFNL